MNDLDDRWQYLDGYLVRLAIGAPKQAMIMLHGANLGTTTGADIRTAENIENTGQTFLEYVDKTDTMLICPQSGYFTLNGNLQQTWDWTGHFQNGREVPDLVDLIDKIQTYFCPTVWLHGGSAGGVMAWRVANELNRMSKLNSIFGLICTESISPFSMSVTGKAPPAFEEIDSNHEFDFAGHQFYSNHCVPAQLGLPNQNSRFYKQMLYQYSPEDELVLTEWKEDFAESLEIKCTSLTVTTSGSAHNLGEQGWVDLVSWLTAKDKL